MLVREPSQSNANHYANRFCYLETLVPVYRIGVKKAVAAAAGAGLFQSEKRLSFCSFFTWPTFTWPHLLTSRSAADCDLTCCLLLLLLFDSQPNLGL